MTFEEALGLLQREPSDLHAWDVVIRGLYDPLLEYVALLLATFRVGRSETAADIVQDVLLSLYERWLRFPFEFRSQGELLAYLRRSCRNRLIDRYRRERRAEQFTMFLGLKFSSVFEAEPDSFRELLAREIINAVSGECAELLQSYVDTDLSLAELADRQGVSPATFYSRWYRCLEKARSMLKRT